MSGYEAVFCIVNSGFSELVMDAAKEVGARGGTVLHARGTANKESEQFFHINIQPDKEIVMILVPSEIKDDVLHSIYRQAGLKSEGQGIAFSLPVDDVVGLAAGGAEIPQSLEENAKESAISEKPVKQLSEPTEQPSEKPTEQPGQISENVNK